MRACACTNTWTREAYNLGALGGVINMKTAQTLTPGVANLPRTRTRASQRTRHRIDRRREATKLLQRRMIACVLSMRRSMSIL